jgi:hybrid cluster-associated redox disulfide protein
MSGEKRIRAEMTVDEIVLGYPETVKTLFRYGLNCVGCHVSAYDSLADGAKAHGVDVAALVDELNRVVDEAAGKPAT